MSEVYVGALFNLPTKFLKLIKISLRSYVRNQNLGQETSGAVISKSGFTMKLNHHDSSFCKSPSEFSGVVLAMCIHGHVFYTCEVKYFGILFLTVILEFI